jgi:hypothetical protein
MKRIYLRRELSRTVGLFFSRALNGTEKTSERSVIRTAALAAAVCTLCFAALWFGVALSPLLFNRNHSSPQSSRRTGFTNSIGELLSGGKTFAYAFRYVLQSDPVEKPDGEERDTNLLTLAEWWPSNFPGSSTSSNLSNYFGLPGNPFGRALRPKTNADG